MGNIKKRVLPLLAFVFVFASCVSNKNLQPTPREAEVEKEIDKGIAAIVDLPAITPAASRMQYLSSNIKLTLDVNGEKVEAINGDTVLRPVYSRDSYTVTFTGEGGVLLEEVQA